MRGCGECGDGLRFGQGDFRYGRRGRSEEAGMVGDALRDCEAAMTVFEGDKPGG